MGSPADKVMVSKMHYAMQGNPIGQWRAVFTAANQEDAQVNEGLFVSDWYDSEEEAEEKMVEVCKFMAEMGLSVTPLKPPS